MTYAKFIHSINLLSLYLKNEKIIELKQEKNDISNDIVQDENEIVWAQENITFVEEMKDIIRNGDVQKLKIFLKQESYNPYGKFANDSLRHFKNSMMVHIYIIRSAAHEAGLAEDICIRLAEYYSQQCESATEFAQLTEISQILRLDFCKRVNEIKSHQYNDAVTNKTIEYIRNHRYEKLNAKIISDALHVSSSYLCHKIKQETQISLVDHILDEKIRLSKKLLTRSSYTLCEIADMLSFSSQAYFQSIFKKKTGVTPLQYRNTKIGTH